MIAGPARGVWARWLRRYRLSQKIDRQHLLRGIYELLEARGDAEYRQADQRNEFEVPFRTGLDPFDDRDALISFQLRDALTQQPV